MKRIVVLSEMLLCSALLQLTTTTLLNTDRKYYADQLARRTVPKPAVAHPAV